jgi:hypothetical protein
MKRKNRNNGNEVTSLLKNDGNAECLIENINFAIKMAYKGIFCAFTFLSNVT